jgi:hypothetical protein
VTWDWSTAAIINWALAFSGNGPLVTNQSNDLTDLTDPDVPSSTLARIVFDADGFEPTSGGGGSGGFGGSGAEEEICVASSSLTLTAANLPYVNSCTEGCTYRKAGVIDWTASVVVQNNRRDLDLDTPFDIGDDLDMRWYINAEEFWWLKWAHVKDFSALTVDVESGAIITQTVALEMNGFDAINNLRGKIVMPGANKAWWSGAAA